MMPTTASSLVVGLLAPAFLGPSVPGPSVPGRQAAVVPPAGVVARPGEAPDGGTPAAADEERGAPVDPFDLDPRELPRAEPGTWDALTDPERREAALGELDDEVQQVYATAQELYLRRDYPGAVRALELCLRRAPDLPPAQQLLGTVYFRVQRYGDAAVCFERLLEHAPDEVWRTQALGHAYYSLGHYDRARDHYRRVLEGRPDDAEEGMLAEARRGLALAHMQLGETEEALSELRTVVGQRPDHSDAWSWIGRIRYEEGELDAAREALERARELAPYEPRPWFLLSKVYRELGLGEQAEATQARWREIDRITQDVRSIEAQLELDPRSYDLALRLVELQKTLGNTEGLRRALTSLLAARPDDLREVDVRVYVLETLLRSGDYEGAEAAAEALRAHCGDDPATWKRLESYYARIGDTKRQVEAGERYLRLRAR